MPPSKVGVRAFRENLASFLESKTRVGITRHCTTIGTYVPGAHTVRNGVRRTPKPCQADLKAFRLAGEQLDAMIAAAGTTAEELIADFEKARKEKRAARDRS